FGSRQRGNPDVETQFPAGNEETFDAADESFAGQARSNGGDKVGDYDDPVGARERLGQQVHHWRYRSASRSCPADPETLNSRLKKECDYEEGPWHSGSDAGAAAGRIARAAAVPEMGGADGVGFRGCNSRLRRHVPVALRHSREAWTGRS